MTKKVDVNKIWKEILKDPEMASMGEPVIVACKPYFMALPEVLEKYLDETVTLKSLMSAKMAFLRYCLDNGYIKACVDATPEQSLTFFDRDELSGMIQNMLESLVEIIEPIANDALKFLKSQGISEDELLTGPNVGLNP